MVKSKLLKREDVSDIVGLPVVVLDAAREFDEDDEPAIGVPHLEELSAAAAVTRCQMAPRLRGRELRVMRKMLDLTQPALGEALGGIANVASMSRWESEAMAIDDRAEKLLRILVCQRLAPRAPGVSFDLDALLALTLTKREARMTAMEFRQVKKKVGHSVEDVWVTAVAAAAKKAA